MRRVRHNVTPQRHGFVSPPVEVTTARREAAREVLRAIEDGPNLERFPLLRSAAAMLAEAFAMIHAQRKPEWFLTSGLMCHPTTYIARKLAKQLGAITQQCDRRDVVGVAEVLRARPYLAARLESYLACTRPYKPLQPVDDAKWIYLVRNKAEWGVVNLGEIDGQVQDALLELEELNPHFGQYSLTAAWRVHDLRAGYAIAAAALQPYFIQTDFYDFHDMDDLIAMRTRVSAGLNEYRLLDRKCSYTSSGWCFPDSDARNLLVSDEPSRDDEEDTAESGFAP